MFIFQDFLSLFLKEIHFNVKISVMMCFNVKTVFCDGDLANHLRNV